MLCQPGRSRGPEPGPRTIAGRRKPPDVADVMGHETVGAVVYARCLPARLTKRLEIVKERLMQLGEIGHFGRPVVHLKIDIEVIVAVPRREHTVVPETLQIRWKTAGTAARNQQVAAKLKIQRLEAEIDFTTLDALQPLI